MTKEYIFAQKINKYKGKAFEIQSNKKSRLCHSFSLVSATWAKSEGCHKSSNITLTQSESLISWEMANNTSFVYIYVGGGEELCTT